MSARPGGGTGTGPWEVDVLGALGTSFSRPRREPAILPRAWWIAGVSTAAGEGCTFHH